MSYIKKSANIVECRDRYGRILLELMDKYKVNSFNHRRTSKEFYEIKNKKERGI